MTPCQMCHGASKEYNKSRYTNLSSEFFAHVRSVQLGNSLTSTISILLPRKLKKGSLSLTYPILSCVRAEPIKFIVEYAGFEAENQHKATQGVVKALSTQGLAATGANIKSKLVMTFCAALLQIVYLYNKNSKIWTMINHNHSKHANMCKTTHILIRDKHVETTSFMNKMQRRPNVTKFQSLSPESSR